MNFAGCFIIRDKLLYRRSLGAVLGAPASIFIFPKVKHLTRKELSRFLRLDNNRKSFPVHLSAHFTKDQYERSQRNITKLHTKGSIIQTERET